MPVVNYYEGLRKLRSVNSDQSPTDVYAQTKGHFAAFA